MPVHSSDVPEVMECKLHCIHPLKGELLPAEINVTPDTSVGRTTNQSQNG